MKHLLKLSDWSKEEIMDTLNLADQLKYEQKHGIAHPRLAGQTLGMIFQKSSTRTRVSFETGMYQLGGQALFLSSRDLQIGRGEPVQDTARVLSCGSADTCTSLHDPVDLAVPLAGATLFIVFFYIAKCRLICQRTDGSCTESLSCTEDNLRIFVRLGLVITGEVQVDIRLFISLKSKEGLEGNIKSLF